MHMINSIGCSLHVNVSGPENAIPVLMINSLGSDLRLWDGVVAQLSTTHRVFRYDKPGHGLSQATARPYRIEDLAKHASNVLSHFDVDQAHIVGISIGGQTAMALTKAYPEKVISLVLSNTAAKIGTGEMWQERIAAIEKNGLKEFSGNTLERWFPQNWRRANPDTVEAYRNMICRTDLDGYLGCCDALASADFTQFCTSITKPTLMIGGSGDGSTPPDVVKATAALITGAEYFEFPDCGHLPCVDRPELYAEKLREFWNRLD